MRARDQFRANVVFVGQASPKREALLTEVIEFGLAVWGPGWRRTTLGAYCRGEQLTEQDYVRAYAGASVALNVHRERGDGARPAGCNQRVFELAAMGAAQVVDRRDDIALHFVPDRHVVMFDGASDLKDRVRSLLNDPPATEALGREARAAALAEHTYMHRMVQLLQTVGAS